jgi:hypothetical protein
MVTQLTFYGMILLSDEAAVAAISRGRGNVIYDSLNLYEPTLTDSTLRVAICRGRLQRANAAVGVEPSKRKVAAYRAAFPFVRSGLRVNRLPVIGSLFPLAREKVKCANIAALHFSVTLMRHDF